MSMKKFVFSNIVGSYCETLLGLLQRYFSRFLAANFTLEISEKLFLRTPFFLQHPPWPRLQILIIRAFTPLFLAHIWRTLRWQTCLLFTLLSSRGGAVANGLTSLTNLLFLSQQSKLQPWHNTSISPINS